MPSEFHNREPPLPFGNPKSRPWYGMDIFWNRPLGNSPGYNTVIALGLALPHWLVDVKMFNNLTPLFQI